MPSIGVRIVYQGNNSSVGHMYTVFKRDDGTSVAFGRYLGGVNNNDGEREKPGAIDAPNVARDFPVSQSAFNNALAAAQQAQAQGAVSPRSGFYDPFTNSCVDFAWSVMRDAGIVDSRNQFDGYFWPKDNTGALGETYFDYFRRPEFNKEGRNVPGSTNTDYTAARGWSVPRDPLVLDLDGDGIETVGINPALAPPVLFDHEADGVKNGTGWIKADDGLLVLDLNGNGTIDTGRELFGDNTLLPSGAAAANGYQALGQHDSNADGRISHLDTVYNQLRIWQDANQDGISQASELKTLAESGIASISVQGTPSNVNLGNGNSQVMSSSFTRINGTTGQSGAAELSGSLLLAGNNFYSDFTTNPPLTSAARALAQMQGSGWTRDLREAASLGTPAAALLEQRLAAFAAATTREGQMALLGDLIEAWAKTTGGFEDVQGRSIGPAGLYQLDVRPAGMTELVYDPMVSGGPVTRLTAAGSLFLYRLSILEVFNGDKFFTWSAPANNGTGGLSSGGGGGSGGAVAGGALKVTLTQTQVDLLNSSWDALANSIYESLAMQTRLRPYLDSISLVIGPQGVTFDSASMFAKLDATYAANAKEGLADLAELVRFSDGTLDGVAALDASLSKLKAWAQAYVAAGGSAEAAWLADLKVQLVSSASVNLTGSSVDDVLLGNTQDNALNGADGDDLILGDAGDDVLGGGNGDDRLWGGVGNDTLNGGNGSDILQGGDGNDILFGEDGNDTLKGGAGNDYLQGAVGDDLLDGGAGNDILAGGSYYVYQSAGAGLGNDSYLFGRGDGQDGVFDNDATLGNQDKLIFKAGVKPADVDVQRSGNDLVLKIVGTTDQVTLSGYFLNDNTSGWAIESIHFADAPGTVWRFEQVKLMVLKTTAGDDSLVGYASDDVLNGAAGNDFLQGNAGNDTLDGGLGDDRLEGGDGNDILRGGDGQDVMQGDAGADNLQGGAGNDQMRGGDGDDTLEGGAGDDLIAGGSYSFFTNAGDGAGNDTYLFGRGSETDRIYDNDATVGNTDKLIFKTGVAVADVRATREGNNLVLSINGTTDKAIINNYFLNESGTSAGIVEEIRFTDAPTTVWRWADMKARVLLGSTGNDTITGYSSNDTLSGGDGNDTIFGRDGNDTINGDAGDDWISGDVGDDRLNGGAGADTIFGGDGVDVITGGAGADILHGDSGNDNLKGDADNDHLQGGDGNDTLDGGAGNDALAGGTFSLYTRAGVGTGNDSYLFGRGDGQDVIYDDDNTAGNADKLTFKAGVAAADVQASRSGNHLVLKINGTSDQVSVYNYFLNELGTSTWLIEQIRFTDAPTTVWRWADMKAKVLLGSPGNDTITGYSSNDTLSGGDGSDTIYGKAGNDIVNGDAGNDWLYGELGNDTLDGGLGDDQLEGGEGSDILRGGDGQDVMLGDSGADNLQGGSGNDQMRGGDGDDTLEGGAGDDYIGGGNLSFFSLTGDGKGNDTYLFGRGSETDRIYDNDATAGNMDVMSFGSNISTSQLWFRRAGADLEVSIIGTTDKVFVNNWYAGAAYQIEQFTTTTGRLLTSAKIDAMVNGMAAIPVTLIGQVTLAPENQAALDALVNMHWV